MERRARSRVSAAQSRALVPVPTAIKNSNEAPFFFLDRANFGESIVCARSSVLSTAIKGLKSSETTRVQLSPGTTRRLKLVRGYSVHGLRDGEHFESFSSDRALRRCQSPQRVALRAPPDRGRATRPLFLIETDN